MSLLTRMAAQDSVFEMEAASLDRYWDAYACIIDDRSFGGCYLLGYAMEMSLKTAYFRFLGVPVGADLQPRLTVVRRHPPFVDRGRNLHDLIAWVELLVETRVLQAQPLDPATAGTLLLRVGEVAWNWSEQMRYRQSVEASDEGQRMFKAVDWMLEHHAVLWS